jgi:hypothetical protein
MAEAKQPGLPNNWWTWGYGSTRFDDYSSLPFGVTIQEVVLAR